MPTREDKNSILSLTFFLNIFEYYVNIMNCNLTEKVPINKFESESKSFHAIKCF